MRLLNPRAIAPRLRWIAETPHGPPVRGNPPRHPSHARAPAAEATPAFVRRADFQHHAKLAGFEPS